MKRFLTLFIVLFIGIHAISQESFISDTINIEHFTISINATDLSDKVLYATTEATVVSKMESLEYAPFYLLEMTIDEIKVNELIINNFQYDGLLLRVPLSPQLSIGERAVISITYHGHPVIEPYDWGGYHFTNSGAYNLGVAFDDIPHCYGRSWFPCTDDFVSRSTYDYFVTTSADKRAICGGILQDSTLNNDGSTTWHWRMNQTIPSYLASVAIADYKEIALPYTSIDGREIPLLAHVFQNQLESAEALCSILPEVMQLFETHWGAYPFDRVGYVSTGKGAMEHPCNIALPTSMFAPEQYNKQVMAHELAHAWFGDLVTCCSAEEMWLNEGWATFNEILFYEGLYGEEAARDHFLSINTKSLSTAHTKDGGFFPLNDLPQTSTYGVNAYEKGGAVIHTLRHYLGDEIFFPAITAFLQQFAYQPVCTEDLMNFLSDYTGLEMNHWFDGWVLQAGSPVFEIDSVVTTGSGSSYLSTIYVEQKRYYEGRLTEDNRVPVTLWNETMTQDTTVIVYFSEKSGSLANVQTTFEPRFAFVDYYDQMADGMFHNKTNLTNTGNVQLESTLTLVIDELTEPTTVYSERFLAAPDPLKTPVKGLILSNRNYWRINGLNRENFVSRVMFNYSRTSLYTDTIFADLSNTLLLLYRPDASHDWQPLPTTTYGGSTTGFLLLDELRWGEYCLAAATDEYTPVYEEVATKSNVNIFPNPSNDLFQIYFRTPINGQIDIYNAAGQMVEELPINANQNQYQWQPKSLPSGIYFLKIVNERKELVEDKKLIFKR